MACIGLFLLSPSTLLRTAFKRVAYLVRNQRSPEVRLERAVSLAIPGRALLPSDASVFAKQGVDGAAQPAMGRVLVKAPVPELVHVNHG
jgi:hypothetical protein